MKLQAPGPILQASNRNKFLKDRPVPRACTGNVGNTPPGLQSPAERAQLQVPQTPLTDSTGLQSSSPAVGTSLQDSSTAPQSILKRERRGSKERGAANTPPLPRSSSVPRGFSGLSCRKKHCPVKGPTGAFLQPTWARACSPFVDNA